MEPNCHKLWHTLRMRAGFGPKDESKSGQELVAHIAISLMLLVHDINVKTDKFNWFFTVFAYPANINLVIIFSPPQ